MSIVKWDPFRNMAGLQERINRLFEEAFPVAGRSDDLSAGAWSPPVDIIDTEDAILIHAELPGVKKEDISLDIKENLLTIKGERRLEKEIKEENYYRQERSYGTFRRTFTLPGAIDPEKIRATFKRGVLEIEIPKPELKRPISISIE